MKDVIIISHFCGFLDGRLTNRFVYLAEFLNEYCNVELITSDFYHTKKIKKKTVMGYSSNITLIEEPGYKKNVSIQRVYSHYVFSQNLKKYLNKREIPDVVYCSIPSISVARVASEYSKKNNITFIIDIQDLWPESFAMKIKNKMVYNLISKPFTYSVNKIYSCADKVVGVSKTFVDKAVSINLNDKEGLAVFIGADMSIFDNYAGNVKNDKKPKDEIWLVYIGTLGHSYDILSAIEGVSLLNEDNLQKKIKFILIGDGPLKKRFKSYAIEKKICAKFLGLLDYPEAVRVLKSCDIAINPIVKGSVATIINKHSDYAMAGLPVVNTQESIEYRQLIDKYQCGINCEVENATQIAEALKKLSNNEKLRIEMGINSRQLAKEKFDRRKTYMALKELIID